MKRFVHDDEQIVFEALRGTEELAEIIKHEWQDKCSLKGVFLSTDDERNKKHPDDNMSAEEIGFATGVFRSSFINDHTFPTYRVNKERFEFAKPLRENYQFDNIFWRSWKKWDIYIRPTSLGFFVIRLTYKLPKPLATEKIASSV
ncbi:MAG TPA: hypothetical protein DDY18_00995, partial [Flavobacterium sp.]|nr:hypothetical protein [Flavobacterium sp.]